MGAVSCGTHCCGDGSDKQEVPVMVTGGAKSGLPFLDSISLVPEPAAATDPSARDKEALKEGAINKVVDQEGLKDNKPAQNEASPQPNAGPSREFRTRITRSKQVQIGMNFDIVDGFSLVVTEITDGAIRDWNDAHPGPDCLEVNDRIMEANGVRGDTEAMLTKLKCQTEWELVVQRPEVFTATFGRQHASDAAVDLRYAPNGNTLVVASVDAGPLADWNAKGGCQIQKGDRIVEMNGVKGSTQQLLSAGRDADELNVTILHYGC